MYEEMPPLAERDRAAALARLRLWIKEREQIKAELAEAEARITDLWYAADCPPERIVNQ